MPEVINIPIYRYVLNQIFFSYKDIPGPALKCTHDGTLKELLVTVKNKYPKKIFYQRLSMPITELENKKPFMVGIWFVFV